MRIEFEKKKFSGKLKKNLFLENSKKNFFLKIVKIFSVDFRKGGQLLWGGNYCVNSGSESFLQKYCIFSPKFFTEKKKIFSFVLREKVKNNEKMKKSVFFSLSL